MNLTSTIVRADALIIPVCTVIQIRRLEIRLDHRLNINYRMCFGGVDWYIFYDTSAMATIIRVNHE